MPTLDQFVVWIVVGLIGGALAGSLSTWSKEGYGRTKNLALGLAGALIGGLLFRLFGLFRISINIQSRCAMSSPHSLAR